MNLIATPARLSTLSATFDRDFQKRLHWSAETDSAIEQRVADILADVQRRGDAAVLEYTERFDALSAPSVQALELTQAEFKDAFDSIPSTQREALQAAAARVRSYHEAQIKACGGSWSYRDELGTLLGQKVTPLDRVGIYVPGGKATYPSTVLMCAIPAHVAGVGEIIMVVPTPRGEKNPLVLATAYVAGVTRAFTIGGAQAVAALCAGDAALLADLQRLLRVGPAQVIRQPDPNRTVDFRVEIGTDYYACVYGNAEDSLPTVDAGLAGIPPDVREAADCWLRFSAQVNVREGPGLDCSPVDVAPPNDFFPVTGRTADGTWWQVSADGVPAWVSAEITTARAVGECDAVPVVE